MKRILSIILAAFMLSQSVYAENASPEDKRKSQSQELHNLINQCKEAGITTDYEAAALQVFDTFISLEQSDLNNTDITEEQNNYTSASMTKIYNTTKSNLSGYLAGTKKPMPAAAGNNDGTRKINGNLFIGKNGEPLFSTGFGHFDDTVTDADALKNMGSNNVTLETGPSSVTWPTSVYMWKVFKNNDCDADVNLVENDGNKQLEIVNRSERNDNKFVLLEQIVPCEPNTNYAISFKGKSEGTTRVEMILDGWDNRTVFDVGSTSKTYSRSSRYTTGDNQYYITFRMAFDYGPTVTIDDIIIKNMKTRKNAVENGDFESDGCYYFRMDFLSDVINKINTMTEKGYSVDFLLSPHYIPDYLVEKYPDISLGSGYGFNYNINHPEFLKFLKNYVKFVMKVTRGCNLSSVCLTNEPGFCTSRAYDFYNPLFKEWLSKKYNNDIAAFNELHGKSYAGFEDINIPSYLKNKSGYPQADDIYYEYMLFNEEVFANWHKELADAVKSVRNVPIHAKMQDYLFFYDNYSIAKTLFGTDVELFNEFCDIAGNDATTYTTQPDSRYVTMMWYDFLSSLTDKPIYNSEDHVILDNNTIFNDTIGQNVRYELLNGAVHSRGASTLWEWDRGFTTLFKNMPDATYMASKSMLDLTRLSNPIAAFTKADKDTAFFYSKASRVMEFVSNWNNAYEEALVSDYKAVSALGHKTGFVTERKPEKISGYKTLIMPEVRYISEDNVKVIADFMRNGGKVILDGSDSLKYNQFGKAAETADRTYIKNNAVYVNSRTAEAFNNAYAAIGMATSFAKVNDSVASGIDLKLASYDGEELIAVTNLEDGNKTVTFPSEYKYTNLYDMTEYSNIINLTAYEPMLLLKEEIVPEKDVDCTAVFNKQSVEYTVDYAVKNNANIKIVVIARDAENNIIGAAYCAKAALANEIYTFSGAMPAKGAETLNVIVLNNDGGSVIAADTVNR